MLDRLVFAIVLIGLGVAVYYVLSRWQLHQAQVASNDLDVQSSSGYRILYFTTPTCVVCKTVQAPALRALEQKFGDDLTVITVDATEQPELAARWQVMSVPTTFILDPTNTPRICNNGLANHEKLIKQLATLGLKTP